MIRPTMSHAVNKDEFHRLMSDYATHLEGQLAKANECVKELEKCCKLHTLPPNVVFDMVEAMIPRQLNKFAIDKKADEFEKYASMCEAFRTIPSIEGLRHHAEQLRKEQQND